MKYLLFALIFISSLAQSQSLYWDYTANTVDVTAWITKCGTISQVYTFTSVTYPSKPLQTKIDIGALGLPKGTYFCVQTAAGPNNAWSVPSNEVSFIVGDPPAAPTNLRVQ